MRLISAVLGVANALFSASDDVVELTQSNFASKVTKSDELWIVEFYAPWCGHCKSMAPEYKKLAKELKVTKLPVTPSLGNLSIKTGSETGFLAQNLDRLLDFQGRISDKKTEQVFKTKTGPKTVFLNRTGCPVLLENLSKVPSRILSPS